MLEQNNSPLSGRLQVRQPSVVLLESARPQKTTLQITMANDNQISVTITDQAVTDIIGQHMEVQLARPQVGRAVLMLLKGAAEHGIRLRTVGNATIGASQCRCQCRRFQLAISAGRSRRSAARARRMPSGMSI